jgi:hypothetical protein
MHKRELHIALFYNYTDIHGTVTMDLFDTINCWRFSSYHEPMHPIAQGPKLFLAFISTIPESLTPIASRPRHAPHETAPRCTYLLRSVTKGRSGAGKSQLTSPSYAHLLDGVLQGMSRRGVSQHKRTLRRGYGLPTSYAGRERIRNEMLQSSGKGNALVKESRSVSQRAYEESKSVCQGWNENGDRTC